MCPTDPEKSALEKLWGWLGSLLTMNVGVKEQNHQGKKVGVRGVLKTELQAMGGALRIQLCLFV